MKQHRWECLTATTTTTKFQNPLNKAHTAYFLHLITHVQCHLSYTRTKNPFNTIPKFIVIILLFVSFIFCFLRSQACRQWHRIVLYNLSRKQKTDASLTSHQVNVLVILKNSDGIKIEVRVMFCILFFHWYKHNFARVYPLVAYWFNKQWYNSLDKLQSV